MPQYRVLQKSFINNSLVEEGAIVEFDGEPSGNLELLDKPKRGRKAAADESDADAPQSQDGA